MKNFIWIVFLSLSAILASCHKNYETIKAKELASGIRNDSIFLGYYLGMPRQDFFQHSLELNQAGLLTNGPQNQTILYHIEEGYKSPISMNFYPDFVDGKIYRMRVYFNYDSWAPWNKAYYGEKCLPDVLDILEKRYFGKGFFDHTIAKGKKTKVQIKGNREVMVSVKDEKEVFVTVTDLTITPPKEKEKVLQPGEYRPLWERTDKEH